MRGEGLPGRGGATRPPGLPGFEGAVLKGRGYKKGRAIRKWAGLQWAAVLPGMGGALRGGDLESGRGLRGAGLSWSLMRGLVGRALGRGLGKGAELMRTWRLEGGALGGGGGA